MKKYKIIRVFADRNVYEQMVESMRRDGVEEDGTTPITYMDMYKGYMYEFEFTSKFRAKIIKFMLNIKDLKLYMQTKVYTKHYVIESV